MKNDTIIDIKLDTGECVKLSIEGAKELQKRLNLIFDNNYNITPQYPMHWYDSWPKNIPEITVTYLHN